MNLKEVLNYYNDLESELLFSKAKALFSLVNDSEIEEILKNNQDNILLRLSNRSEEYIKKDKQLLLEAIDLFTRVIESRNLTEDEFESMTLDDIKEYINKIIVDKRTILLEVINRLEDLYKD